MGDGHTLTREDARVPAAVTTGLWDRGLSTLVPFSLLVLTSSCHLTVAPFLPTHVLGDRLATIATSCPIFPACCGNLLPRHSVISSAVWLRPVRCFVMGTALGMPKMQLLSQLNTVHATFWGGV